MIFNINGENINNLHANDLILMSKAFVRVKMRLCFIRNPSLLLHNLVPVLLSFHARH